MEMHTPARLQHQRRLITAHQNTDCSTADSALTSHRHQNEIPFGSLGRLWRAAKLRRSTGKCAVQLSPGQLDREAADWEGMDARVNVWGHFCGVTELAAQPQILWTQTGYWT